MQEKEINNNEYFLREQLLLLTTEQRTTATKRESAIASDSLETKAREAVGTLIIQRSLLAKINGSLATGGNCPRTRRVSVIDFLEVYAYSALLLLFSYVIAMAVVGMAYGGDNHSKKNSKSGQGATTDNIFFVEYMISIVLVPVACQLLSLSIKGKLMMTSYR